MSDCAKLDDRTDAATNVDRLIGLWSRLLQVSTVLPDSNFFDLGGDSLLAVNLFLEIERATGRQLPITTIYDAPTVAELAALMDSEAAPRFSPLVPLKDGDGTAPFYIVHGIGGTVIELAALGKLIRTKGPVYAVQARGLDGIEPPFTSIAAMAEYYLETIRQIQPAGPYLLGGYSFGGLVAFEMARLLERAHELVAQLVMIDAYAHPQTWPLKSRVTVRGRRLLGRLRLIARNPVSETAAYANDLAGRFSVGRKSAAPQDRQARSWLGPVDPSLPLALRQVRQAGDAALLSYRPQFYPGKITFLKAAKTDPVFPPDPSNIWRPLARDFELHTVRGNHRSIIETYAADTAECISACLAPPVPAQKASILRRAVAGLTLRGANPLQAGTRP